MKEESYYTSEGLQTVTTGYSYISSDKTIEKIEILVKALGTMVLKPQFEVDPNQIGKKYQIQPIQEAILLDDNRKVAEDKLVELIKQL